MDGCFPREADVGSGGVCPGRERASVFCFSHVVTTLSPACARGFDLFSTCPDPRPTSPPPRPSARGRRGAIAQKGGRKRRGRRGRPREVGCSPDVPCPLRPDLSRTKLAASRRLRRVQPRRLVRLHRVSQRFEPFPPPPALLRLPPPYVCCSVSKGNFRSFHRCRSFSYLG